MKNIPKRLRNVVYVDLKTDTVSCDGNMKTSVDGHPRVYMSFSSQKSHVGKMIEDRNQVRCSYLWETIYKKIMKKILKVLNKYFTSKLLIDIWFLSKEKKRIVLQKN